MKAFSQAVVFLFLCFTGCAHSNFSTGSIKNPFSDLSPMPSAGPNTSGLAGKCKLPPDPVIDPPGVSFYNDNFKTGHASIIDPEQRAIRNQQVAPLNEFLAQADTFADEIWKTANAKSLTCFENLLATWALQKGMLGTPSPQGVFERVWFLSGVSLAYLRVKSRLPNWQGASKDRIDAWLEKLAQVVQSNFSGHEKISQKNNLSYWAGLSVLSVAVVRNNPELFSWGLTQIRFGIEQVNIDGFLPLELTRGQRALHYHAFALQPLMMAAFIARANGINLFSESGAALQRLVHTTLAGFKDAEEFQQQTKAKQELPDSHILSWLEIYAFLFPTEKDFGQQLRSLRPVKDKWLGGNLTDTFAR